MKKILYATVVGLILNASYAFAHHPTANIVDPEIYAMISELLEGTPHETIIFDEDMGTTTIPDLSVSSLDQLIRSRFTLKTYRRLEAKFLWKQL
jgi:hypothetical protein